MQLPIWPHSITECLHLYSDRLHGCRPGSHLQSSHFTHQSPGPSSSHQAVKLWVAVSEFNPPKLSIQYCQFSQLSAGYNDLKFPLELSVFPLHSCLGLSLKISLIELSQMLVKKGCWKGVRPHCLLYHSFWWDVMQRDSWDKRAKGQRGSVMQPGEAVIMSF